MIHFRRFLVFGFFASLLLVLISGRVEAGGGPENVFLVVNPKSVDSMTVANYYIQLRNIPSRNVFYLDWDPEVGLTNITAFREKILTPILKAIDDRGLIGQVDYVVYSVDYPWGVDLYSDVKVFLEDAKKQQKPGDKPIEWPKMLSQRGSITGLTYLYQLVLTGQPAYMGLTANNYMRIMKDEEQTVPTIGFSNRLRFDIEGKPTEALTGIKYLLSVSLGITGKDKQRGNTVEEIIQYLERSVKADGTLPAGIIYYDDHNDVRSQTRKPLFAAAIQALGQLGVRGEIIDKNPPPGAMDIMGMTLGSAKVRVEPWRQGVRPGALCDNLTSEGGIMRTNSSQTPLTDFLAAGMAGASGAVVEPYAIPMKFPSPMLHVHYARGCSMAEAFYQSIHGPYQLLIVGEPLCKPWARIPRVSIYTSQAEENGTGSGASTENSPPENTPRTEGQVSQNALAETREIAPGQIMTGKIILHPSAELAGGHRAHHFEIYVDGHLVGICLSGGDVPINTARFGDGYHELRVVAVGPQPVYTRGYQIVPIQTANHGRSIEATIDPASGVELGKPIVVTAKCPGAKQIEIGHNGRVIAQVDGETGQAEIDTKKLGQGPVVLQAVGVLGEGATNRAFSEPISVIVK